MEPQSLEFTVEDLLQCHRGWITELYVNDKKTEVEILELLHERRIFVTLEQIRRCIGEWDLVQLPVAESSVPSPSPTLSDDWELVSTPPKPEAIPRYTPSDPALVFEYNQKPLPSIPVPKAQQKSTKIQKRRPSTTDRLKLTCHHGPNSSDVHEVQTRLKSIPDGTSPIDRFTKDSQTHERIALGLCKDHDEHEDMASIALLSWRRATEPAGPSSNIMRQCRGLRTMIRKPKNDKNDRNEGLLESESSGKRKRGPPGNGDDEQGKDRKKTPPSPPDEE
ncbi:hypothetical protein N431DRAFT_560976 [Stipitochalara longipes BDJ]|nr:hypothetical protein N431DRAFT_560976 [Stipitochalara longipes BDJ]